LTFQQGTKASGKKHVETANAVKKIRGVCYTTRLSGHKGSVMNDLRNGLPRLILALGVLILIMYVLAPMAIRVFPPLRDYAHVVNETGIMPGALYYSDVPQTVDGEFNNRDAIRFRVHPEHTVE
jgi:hypothetical protein